MGIPSRGHCCKVCQGTPGEGLGYFFSTLKPSQHLNDFSANQLGGAQGLG